MMMNISVSAGVDALCVSRPGQCDAVYPLPWLRHNCPSGLHPQTHERMYDFLEVPVAATVENTDLGDGVLTIHWSDDHQSQFPVDWLLSHVPGERAPDAAAVPKTHWVAGTTLPRHSGPSIVDSEAALISWMQDTSSFGVSIVENVSGGPEAGMAVATRIAHLRETNFGRTFEVMNKPDPNNLAYTAHALPLHTDLPNQEMAPGYQFLHCIANEATGGGSIFVDGFAVADALKQEDPAAWALLTQQAVPYRFHDTQVDLRMREPVIVLDYDGALKELRHSPHLIDAPDMPPEVMGKWYAAYRVFLRLLNDPTFQVTLKLQAGEIAVFDNRRILHGRESFDPASGFRHLHGCYVDRGDFDSRLRVMSRADQAETVQAG